MVLAAIDFTHSWPHINPKRIGISAADGSKFYVPDDIVKSKDCVAFESWRDGLIRPGFVPTNPKCPWEPLRTGIGEFIINGTSLRIPRGYLWQGGNDPDGMPHNNELYLMVDYPSMKPASSYGDQANNLNIRIQANGPKAHLVFYRTQSDIEVTSELLKSNEPIFIRSLNWLGLDYYKIPASAYEEDVFLKGNPHEPEEWIICTHNVNSRCNTAFGVNDRLLVEVGFREFPHLKQYREINTAVIELINSFVTKGE